MDDFQDRLIREGLAAQKRRARLVLRVWRPRVSQAKGLDDRRDREGELELARLRAIRPGSGERRTSQSSDETAHLASQNANLEPLIEGPAISLAARHTKIRRDGYRR